MARRYDRSGLHVIVGMGSAGSRHLGVLRSLGIQRLAVVRTHSGPTRRFTPLGVQEFAHLSDALALLPSAVLVATPTSLHFSQALAALNAGAPVFVEKPMSCNTSEANKLVQVARQSGTILYVGYHLRHHPLIEWIRTTTRSRVLGEPRLLRASWGEHLEGWHPGESFRNSYAANPSQGGGPLLTLSHVADYAVSFLGSARTITRTFFRLGDLGIESSDTAVINIQHHNGAVSLLEMDFWTRPRMHQVELRFQRGTLNWDVFRDVVSIEATSEVQGALKPLPDPFSREACFEIQMRRFLDSLERGIEPDYERELAVARIIDAGIP